MENKNFAVKLKKLRIEKEISQQDLAKLIDISTSTVGMYEQRVVARTDSRTVPDKNYGF